MKEERPLRLDVIGCFPDDQIISREEYEPFQRLQDLIGLPGWIERFDRDL